MIAVTVMHDPTQWGSVSRSPALRHLKPAHGIRYEMMFRPNRGDVLDLGDGWDNYVHQIRHNSATDVVVLVSPSRPT